MVFFAGKYWFSSVLKCIYLWCISCILSGSFAWAGSTGGSALVAKGNLGERTKESIAVSKFSDDGLAGWESKVFAGETRYWLVDEDVLQNGLSLPSRVLKAVSDASASGLIKTIRVDLDKTPFLQWRWKISKRVEVENERKEKHDDYAARVYVIVDGGFFAWNSMAINYVWANGLDKGVHWGNAFAPNHSKMIALRSKEDELHRWYSEKQNVRKDFIRLFGKNVRYIDVVAIMTDTDNSLSSAESYYGDIVFTTR